MAMNFQIFPTRAQLREMQPAGAARLDRRRAWFKRQHPVVKFLVFVPTAIFAWVCIYYVADAWRHAHNTQDFVDRVLALYMTKPLLLAAFWFVFAWRFELKIRRASRARNAARVRPVAQEPAADEPQAAPVSEVNATTPQPAAKTPVRNTAADTHSWKRWRHGARTAT